MTPIVAIVGRSKSGKTTLVERLIAELTSRGYRIATLKHTPMGIAADDKDKNTERHLKAGSEMTIAVGPNRLVMYKPVRSPVSEEDAARLFEEDYDLILAEGFKQGDTPKVEVHRHEVGTPLKGLKKLLAVVTDEQLENGVRQFGLDDIKEIADLLEEGYIKPNLKRVSLYLNGENIPLTLFPKEIIPSTVIGMVKALKGSPENISSIKLFVRTGEQKRRSSRI